MQIVLPVSFSYLEMTLLLLLISILAISFLIGRKYYILKQNSHDRSNSILNNIQDGVYRTDLDGNMIWCSPSALKILRVNSPEIIKKVNVKDFYVNPEHRNELLTKLQENGQVSNYETLLRRMDGGEIVISCNSTYWYDDNGKIAGIEGVFRDITENKQAKKALIESEEKYRSLVEGASEAIFSVDSNGIFLYMNNVAAKRLEGNPENFIGKTMWEVFPKHIADSQMISIGKVFENGIGRSSQTATIIGGKKYRYSTNLQPIKDSLGEISAVLGVARDITSLINTQQDLQNERDFVESLLETANSLIVCMDKYARITVFNREIERLTGYSRDEVIGKSWPEIFLPKDHYHHKIDNFEEWVRKNPSDQLEAQIKTKTGELRTILWSNSTLFHPDSDEFTAITVGLDITDKKEIEKAQKESEARFKESLKYSQTVLYRLDLKTNTYDYISDIVYDFIGYTPEEIIKMGADGVNDLVHPDDKEFQANYRYKLFEIDKGDQSTRYTESRIKAKNGNYIWSGDSHALVRDDNGEPLYIIGCARDITKHKLVEHKLRQSELLNRKTLDSIDEAIHVINLNMEIVLMNNTFLSWCDKFGMQTDVIGKSIFDLFPFLPKTIKQEYQQVLQTGETFVTEEKNRIGGKTVITETRKIPVMDDGTITSLVTIIRDITFQRQAEAARIESELRFHEALENSHDILYRLNLKTNLYDYMSNSVFKLTGYTRDEVLAVKSDGINTITHPDDLKITENYRKRLIEADQGKEISHTIEYRIQHKDEHYIWLGDSHTLIRDAEGEPIYIIGVARDITAQKLSEIRHKARINLLDNLRKANDIDSCLEYGCRAILEANLFERAVLTLHNNKKEIVNIGYIGLDDETIKAARNAPPPNDALLAKLTQKQFRISNSYFIPAESGVLYVQTDRFVSQEDFSDLTYSTWSPGDELFVPIKGDSDKYEGWLSVDTPMNRKRPTLEIITLLEETVDIVTQKIREINTQNILDEKHNALIESEEKYRNLIDSSPDAIVIMKNGKVAFVNSMYNKLLGYKLGELGDELGFGKLIHKDDLEVVYQRMKDRKAGKEVPNL
ncbi:MAG: PAS domain S-box protein, partial [candidate division Zixibacteria bacterium]|nr:PAS domain S-box protein [candidate division Zixibacteria bacterium]